MVAPKRPNSPQCCDPQCSPSVVIAVTLPWQPACRPESIPSLVPTNSTNSSHFLTLSTSERQTRGLLPKLQDWGLTRGQALPLVLQMGPTALPITLSSHPRCGHHAPAHHEVESGAPQATRWHSKVHPITARRNLCSKLRTQDTLHANSWLGGRLSPQLLSTDPPPVAAKWDTVPWGTEFKAPGRGDSWERGQGYPSSN